MWKKLLQAIVPFILDALVEIVEDLINDLKKTNTRSVKK